MNPVLTYFLSSVERSTSNLKLKNTIIDKPWVWVENTTAKAKFIFKRNGTLVVSIAGIAHNGNWEYLSGAKSIHIDSEVFNFLLNEVYLDENILLFKLDASDDQLLVFCNESSLPELGAQGYLHTVYCTKHGIKSFNLYNGNFLLIHGYEYYHLEGKRFQIVNKDLTDLGITEGRFLSSDRERTYVLKNGTILKIIDNTTATLEDGSCIEIDESSYPYYATSLGVPLPNGEYISKSKRVYIIENGLVTFCGWDKSHSLADKSEIVIREHHPGSITVGDRIIGRILLDGKYRIKGRLWSITVKNQIIKKC